MPQIIFSEAMRRTHRFFSHISASPTTHPISISPVGQRADGRATSASPCIYSFDDAFWANGTQKFHTPHVKNKRRNMPQNFTVKTCMPHEQVSGRHVCFLQFTTRPPQAIKQWLLPAIKESGNAYRPGPPGYDSGWHIHDPEEVASRVHRRWPELSEALLKVARFIRRHPDRVSDHRGADPQTQQTSGLDILTEAALGPKRTSRGRAMEIVKV